MRKRTSAPVDECDVRKPQKIMSGVGPYELTKTGGFVEIAEQVREHKILAEKPDHEAGKAHRNEHPEIGLAHDFEYVGGLDAPCRIPDEDDRDGIGANITPSVLYSFRY